MIFNYYLDKADASLDVSGLPNYQAIADYLENAAQFALTKEMQQAVTQRETNIQMLTLQYKIEVDMSKGSIESLKSALRNLKKVLKLTSDPARIALTEQSIEKVTADIVALETQEKEQQQLQEQEQQQQVQEQQEQSAGESNENKTKAEAPAEEGAVSHSEQK